jgi:hypothetical protein
VQRGYRRGKRRESGRSINVMGDAIEHTKTKLTATDSCSVLEPLGRPIVAHAFKRGTATPTMRSQKSPSGATEIQSSIQASNSIPCLSRIICNSS